jgi:2-keto-4-pentenoate hydratase/2-oxohepta-3-ene-1,7-dioic acid hydratase in catechol pathway
MKLISYRRLTRGFGADLNEGIRTGVVLRDAPNGDAGNGGAHNGDPSNGDAPPGDNPHSGASFARLSFGDHGLSGRVLDLTDWIRSLPITPEASRRNAETGIEAPSGGIMRWLQSGPVALGTAQELIAAAGLGQAPHFDELKDIELYAPVPRPGKIIGVGRNYADHAKETGVDPFEKPRIIFKVPSSVAAPGKPIPRPPGVTKLDFEVELAVVIGSYAKNVSKEDALKCVAGYTILNDASAREFQFDISPAQTTFAKSMDCFAPMGPWLVTADEIPNPQNLEVFCWLNGEQMQHGHTRDMLFPVATLIAYLSQFMTLEPGDVIATGTPAGIGAFRKPPLYLKPGDQLRFEVSQIGQLEHMIT